MHTPREFVQSTDIITRMNAIGNWKAVDLRKDPELQIGKENNGSEKHFCKIIGKS